jgi:uncharacterized protein (TIRG00374 family)
MRKIIIALIALLSIAFVYFSLTELQNIVSVLRESKFAFLLLAILVEIICLFNTAATFDAIYNLVGLTEKYSRMFLMTTAANFVSMVAPSGGFGGIAILVDEARQRNISAGRVMVVGALYLIYEYASLLLILVLGFIILIQRGSLNTGELIAAGLLLTLALTLGAILFLAYRSPEQLGKLLAKLSVLANRMLRPFLQRDVLKIENAYHFSNEIAEGVSTMRKEGKRLVWPFLFTLNNKALLIAVLTCSFLALGTSFTIGTIIGGFSISYLFFYVSPTPSGVGFVEGILPSALNTLGVPITQGFLITLVFRAVTLWFPFAVGAATFRILQNQPKTATN